MAPRTEHLLPLFPLPNVVFFPGVPLPLHIFEPRYRAMVADALEADRRIVMVLLKAGFEADYEGRPPIFPIGCSGVIVHSAKLEDGRFNIMLNGLERVRVVEENHDRAYRRAVVEALADPPLEAAEEKAVRELRRRLEQLAGLGDERPYPADSATAQLREMPDERFIYVLTHASDFDPLEKQAVLQAATLRERAEALVSLFHLREVAKPGYWSTLD